MAIKKNIRSCFLYFLALSLIIQFAGCFPYSTPSLLINKNSAESIRHDWKGYGAYYEYDELFLESSFSTAYIPFAGNYSTPVKQHIISRRLRILTKDGMKYATMEIPILSNSIDEFYVTHRKEDGTKIPLNLYSLESEYLKTGKIIVPKATAGSIIDVKIVYRSNGALTTYEHWFTRNIPVHKAKFTFSAYKEFEFSFKEYGGVKPYMYTPSPDNDELTYYEWHHQDILPRKSIAFQEPIDQSLPRISAVMRYAFDKPVFSTWKKISDEIAKDLLDEPFTILDDYLDSLLLTFDFTNNNDEERAQKLLTWIQKNIEMNEYDEEFNPDYIIRDKSGSIWEIAVLCKEMFKRIYLFSDIIMTRPSSLGGFDKSFVTPKSMAIPLVLTKLNGVSKIAYPYIYGGKLGDYPIGYFNQQGISLKKADWVDLPKPLSANSKGEYTFSVDLNSETSTHKMDALLSGYAAYHYRSMIYEEEEDEVKEWFQDKLTDLNKANRLDKFEVNNKDNLDKPLHITIEFSNDNQVVSKKGKSHFSLSHLFDSYFTSLDSTRTTPFQYRIDMHLIEKVQIKKSNGQEIISEIKDIEVKNDLFEFSYSINDKPDNYEIKRELFIKEGKIEPLNFPPLLNDIAKLNTIKSQYVLIN